MLWTQEPIMIPACDWPRCDQPADWIVRYLSGLRRGYYCDEHSDAMVSQGPREVQR